MDSPYNDEDQGITEREQIAKGDAGNKQRFRSTPVSNNTTGVIKPSGGASMMHNESAAESNITYKSEHV